MTDQQWRDWIHKHIVLNAVIAVLSYAFVRLAQLIWRPS